MPGSVSPRADPPLLTAPPTCVVLHVRGDGGRHAPPPRPLHHLRTNGVRGVGLVHVEQRVAQRRAHGGEDQLVVRQTVAAWGGGVDLIRYPSFF